jgi:hypothetical protein
MENEIPDLWGQDLKLESLTPVMVLNTQAEKLKQRTQGAVYAEVILRKSPKITEILFDLRAPAVHGYRFRLLKVRHGDVMVYPAAVISPNMILASRALPQPDLVPDDHERDISALAKSYEEFNKLIGVTFQSPLTRTLLDSLIAKSNEGLTLPPGVILEDWNEANNQRPLGEA